MPAPAPTRHARWTRLLDQANRRYGPWLALLLGSTTTLLWREGIDQIRAAIVLASLVGALTLLLVFPPWDRARVPDAANRGWVRTAAWWATANLAQNALGFVIPFYVLSTTWPSRSAPFTLTLVGLGVLSCFDAVLRERVLRGGWAAVAFVTPILLASIQLFLPMLTGIAPRHTIFGAGAVAALAAGCLAAPDTFMRRRPSPLPIFGVAVAGALLARLALPLLAPAPLRFASAQFALGRDGLEPVTPVSTLVADPSAPAYVFVAIEAPRGLHERVRLVVAEEESRETRPLEIEGGREGGYRLWAPVAAAAPGRIRATVRTEGGQIVGAASIEVVPQSDGK